MKKALLSVTILVIIAMAFTSSVFAASTGKITEQPDMKIFVDGKPVECKNVPILANGNTLLPLKELATILGVPDDGQHIIYEASNKSVTILKDNTKIVVYIGKLNAYVNDKPQKLATIPIIYGKGSTYVPFRFVAEALGQKVIWDGPSKSILLCDAVKFDSVKAVMDKVAAEYKKTTKYKMDMGIDVGIKSENISTKMGISASADIDKANKKMYMLMDMDLLGMKISTETYYSDNASYTQDPLTGDWNKKTYLKPEYDKVFDAESSGKVFNSDDTFCAGLTQVQSANADEILLKGNLFDSSLYDSLLDQNLGGGLDEGLGEEPDGEQGITEDSAFDTINIEIAIDKNTYLVKSIIMTMKSEQTEDEIDTAMDMTAEIVYTDYNGDFEVIVPEDILNNAVEEKTSLLK